MRTSRSLFEPFERLDARERRVVAAGALISALALAAVYVVLPYARRWSERAARIEAKAEQVARLEALVAGEAQMRDVLTRLEERRDRDARRLLEGGTPALAASGLQTLLRSYAERSRVTLERVDISRDFQSVEGSLTGIPAQVVVRGDVYGLVDFLFYLQNGEKLLVIDQLQVSTAFGGGVGDVILSWSVSLHGLYLPEEAAA